VASESKISNPQSPFPNPFAIRTPTAIVTDLGTEFGVEVNDRGHTLSHVFRGAVEMQTLPSDGVPSQSIRLTANQSASVLKTAGRRSTVLQRATLDPTSFVRTAQGPDAKSVDRVAFRRWQASSDRLRADTSLLAYYDFQKNAKTPTILTNVAANAKDGAADGIVENARWASGRMPGKHALLFNGINDCVRMTLSQTTADISVSLWVCVSVLTPENGNSGSCLLMSEGWTAPGQFQYQIENSSGSLVFAVFGSPQSKPVFTSPVVFNEAAFRRWTHLVCVYDHSMKRGRFYAQGQMIADGPYDATVPICLGKVRIGNWNLDPRNLRGKIDEMAVFGRPLSNAEIKRVYEEGRPP
jgi:hypothetical protein